MGPPSAYQTSQPLLVIRGTLGILCGKLMVVSGGHRLLLAAQTKHILFLPYQEIDVRDLKEFDTKLNLITHEPLLAFHVETTNPRPVPYDIIQQVGLFGRLKRYWVWQETMRIREIGKKKLSAMTQNKLLDTYAELQKDAKGRNKFAIAFIDESPSDPTKKGYMTGAEHLLKADVLDDLYYLEATGPVRFNKSSLNTVRNWTVEKIKNTVLLWVTRRRGGFPFTCVFSDSTGHEVDGKKRGRKRKNRNNDATTFTDAPPGWESFITWKQMGTMKLVEELENKVKESVEKAKKECNGTGSNATALDIGEDKLEVISLVRLKLDEMKKRGQEARSFDLAELVIDAITKYESSKYSEVAAMLHGGVLQVTFTLWNSDANRIERLSMATEDCVMFTLYYLNNWSSTTLSDVYVLDSAYLTGWFDKPFKRIGKNAKTQLIQKVERYSKSNHNPHNKVWHTSITLLLLCGNNHWSLAIICGLPKLLRFLEKNPSSPKNASLPANIKTDSNAAIFWLDSLGPKQSLHKGMEQNIMKYLSLVYPGGGDISADDIQNFLPVHWIGKPEPLQTGLECGFYVTYHASLVSRDVRPFLTLSPDAVHRYLQECFQSYPFPKYTSSIHQRLRAYKTMYRANPSKPASARTFFWPSEQQSISSSSSAIGSRLSTPPLVHDSHPPPQQTESKPNSPAKPANARISPTSLSQPPALVPAAQNQSLSQRHDNDDSDEDDFMPSPPRKKRDVKSSSQNTPYATPELNIVAPLHSTHAKAPPQSSQASLPPPKAPTALLSDPTPPVRQALIGVLNGLFRLDTRPPPPAARTGIIDRILGAPNITESIARSNDPSKMDVYLSELTPIVVQRYQDFQSDNSKVVSTDIPNGNDHHSSPNLAFSSKFHTRQPLPSSSQSADILSAMVAEGSVLARENRDKQLTREWELCMKRAQDIFAQLKSTTSS
ncbi:MADS-box transcription factor [Gracilaria domingensis]|nr:MADS-box transcription factor [Gracilaria domingensis]